MHSADDLVMCLNDFNGHVGRHIDGFDRRMLLEFCLEKELCMSSTWLKREEKRKVAFGMSENETEMLIKKEHRQFFHNMKAIQGEIQHALVIAIIDNGEIWKVVRKTCAERRKITLLKDVKIRKRFEEKVTKLVDVGLPNL